LFVCVLQNQNKVLHLSNQNEQFKPIQAMNNSTITIESEWKRRTDLIENSEFVKSCIEVSKKLGVTAKEWNENRAGLLMFFANEFCNKENQSA
jgi:hypothetical protein